MLVLSRRPGERIVIGDTVVVSLVAVGRGRVRLGVECPRGVPVYREEILDMADRGPADLPSPGVTVLESPAAARLKATSRRGHTPRKAYAGWTLVYESTEPSHPFVRALLREVRQRYDGIRATAKYAAAETLDLRPAAGVEMHSSDRVGQELESLMHWLHSRMVQGAE